MPVPATDAHSAGSPGQYAISRVEHAGNGYYYPPAPRSKESGRISGVAFEGLRGGLHGGNKVYLWGQID